MLSSLFCDLVGAGNGLGCLTARLGVHTYTHTHTQEDARGEVGYTQAPQSGSYNAQKVAQSTNTAKQNTND